MFSFFSSVILIFCFHLNNSISNVKKLNDTPQFLIVKYSIFYVPNRKSFLLPHMCICNAVLYHFRPWSVWLTIICWHMRKVEEDFYSWLTNICIFYFLIHSYFFAFWFVHFHLYLSIIYLDLDVDHNLYKVFILDLLSIW